MKERHPSITPIAQMQDEESLAEQEET